MTTMQHEQKRGPGRPPKSETQQRRRKKRDGGVVGKRLAVPDAILDHEKFVYRFMNDTDARLFNKTKEDDWDIVDNDGRVEESADLGNAVSRVVGRKPDGRPLLAYLCRKPRTYFDEDQAEKTKALDNQLAELRRGHSGAGESQADYIPKTGINIG